LFAWTIERVPERLFLGHGTGAWGFDYSGEDRREAPHNIIMELLYEQGLVGVLLISLFLWVIFVRWRRASKLVYFNGLDMGTFQIVHITGLLFSYTLLQAMGSYDINENRFMFFCAGTVVAAFNCVRHRVEEIYEGTEVVPFQWHEPEEVYPGAEFLY
jgi:O-antigen ligase